jgi:hypothetical protein
MEVALAGVMAQVGQGFTERLEVAQLGFNGAEVGHRDSLVRVVDQINRGLSCGRDGGSCSN